MFTHHIETGIDIAAPAGRVWRILTDFADFPNWNPFIRRAEGDLRVGGRLKILIQPSGTKGMTFRPYIRSVEAEHELRWLGHLGLPKVFDGEHLFRIDQLTDDSCRLTQSEHFRGLLVPFFRAGLERDTRRGFHEMNAAIKTRAESL